MFKFLIPFVLLATMFGFPSSPYSKMINRVESSVVRITGQKEITTFFGDNIMVNYVCSGEVIGPDLILTAAHCVSDHMNADYSKATLIKADAYYDLAILSAKTDKPALKMNDFPVLPQEELTGIGYAEGFTRMVNIKVEALLIDYTPDMAQLAPGLFVHPSYISGMSGGPVVNSSGELVGIVQGRTEGLGYGVGMVLIRAFLLGT